MRLTVNRHEFRKAFAIAASLLGSRTPKASTGVFLAPRDGHVLLTSTDDHMVVQTAVKASSQFGRSVMLPKRVGRILSAAQGEDITLEVSETTVEITGDRSRFNLRTSGLQPNTKPPEIVIDERHVEISSRLFRRAVRSTAFATLTFIHTINMALRSVYICVTGNRMAFTATDGTKVAQFTADVAVGDFECEYTGVLIAPDILRHLGRLAIGPTVKMCLKDDTHAVFGFGDTTCATVRLVSGSFPKLDDVFGTFSREAEHYETVEVMTGDLAAMLARAAIISTKEHQVVRLSVVDSRVWAQMRTPEVGEARCCIDVLSGAIHVPVTLDVELLRQGMAALDPHERVWLSIPDKDLPLRMFTDNFTYVVMPFCSNTHQRHAYGDAIGTSR